MVDIIEVSAIVTAAGVLVGIVYYILEMKNQTRIRKTDLIIRLYSRLHSSEFEDAYPKIMNLQFRDYDDFVKKYGTRHSGKNPELDRAIGAVCGFFELVGTLLHRKHIDLVLVYDSFGVSMIKEVWEKIKPLTVAIRREVNDPAWGAGFEYLYNELMKKEPQLRKTLPTAYLTAVSDSKSSNQSSGC